MYLVRVGRYLALALILLGCLWRSPVAAAQIDRSLPASAGGLVTDGRWLAWMVRDADGLTNTISILELTAGDASVVSDLSVGTLQFAEVNLDLGLPLFSLGDGTLAYAAQARSGETQIAAVRLATRERYEIAYGQGLNAPAAFGSAVYWWSDASGSAQLHAALLGGGSAVRATVANTPLGLIATRASAGWVAWARGSMTTAGTRPCFTLEAMEASGGVVQQVADLGCGAPRFDLRDDRLIYFDRDGILVRQNLRDGSTTKSGPHCSTFSRSGILLHCAGLSGFSSDGRYASWAQAQGAPGEAPVAYDLWGFDMDTGSAFTIAAALRQEAQSASPETVIGGGTTAWLWRPSGGGVLRMVPTGATLPGAPEQPLAPATRFFPETSHNLGGEFRAFWERNGGLATFGYPLTREFIQQSRDDGNGYSVQYLERQRFEFHPEHAGSPYAVEIGRMGAEALEAQGRSWIAMPKADPATPHYFPQTGQAIAPEFWDYWSSHGLELGEPGVSERESLALWGYPLSPPQQERLENGETLLVQWFERARFEYHPANPDPYKVLLGRLAADQVEGMFR